MIIDLADKGDGYAMGGGGEGLMCNRRFVDDRETRVK
jgi:hypothetical protein